MGETKGGVPTSEKGGGKRCESKRIGDNTLFRDGEGILYDIKDEAVPGTTRHEFGEWLVGGNGQESPNKPFEFETQKEALGYVEDKENYDGDNMTGYGGIHLPVDNWRKALVEHPCPSEVKHAIEKSVLAAIVRLKENKEVYPPDVQKKMLERIQE
ncbi:MAG: hypothetical protein AAB963_00720 [Patescibacteria group bacterium]